jgi:hypothetical protein
MEPVSFLNLYLQLAISVSRPCNVKHISDRHSSCFLCVSLYICGIKTVALRIKVLRGVMKRHKLSQPAVQMQIASYF